MNCIRTLREAARVEPNMRVAKQLRFAADNLEEAVEAFITCPELAQLIVLNGMWSRATYVLKLASPIVDPTPPTTIVEQERKAA